MVTPNGTSYNPIPSGGHGFGSAGVLVAGETGQMEKIGYLGNQIEGCLTYNAGTRPVSDFTIGGGFCAAIQLRMLDGAAK